MRSNEQKILYLFDEIGKIEDKYVAEAMEYKRYAPKRQRVAKIFALAACIALITALCIAGAANIAKALFDQKGNDTIGEQGIYETSDALCEVMTGLDIRFLNSVQISSPTSELIFDGNVRIIWTYGNGVYYSLTLSQSDAEALEKHLSDKNSSRVSPNEDVSDFRFYVSHGNGLIETPYIEDNAGRFSVGSLSDYLPEVYPSSEFADLIGSIVKQAEN